ncbi:MAG: hypothetical protein KatS3mg087_2192 [Patescibacteria group bacterium]|nr:MAG: hypothetical protein KatS3mg087_2192 [Patescibacteria group bacterium]
MTNSGTKKSEHLLQLVDKYGWYLLELKRYEKSPLLHRWTDLSVLRANKTAESYRELVSRAEQGKCNLGLFLGEGLACVDIDIKNALHHPYQKRIPDWVRRNLPATEMMDGAGSILKHLFYCLSSPLKQTTLRVGGCLELHTGSRQMVIPPSVIDKGESPTGDRILDKRIWFALGDPLLIDPTELEDRVRLLGAVLVVAKYYIEGSRNNITLYLSGWLRKSGKEQGDVEEIVRLLCDLSGDNLKERLPVVARTFEKPESEVSGYQNLVEFVPEEDLREVANLLRLTVAQDILRDTPDYVIEGIYRVALVARQSKVLLERDRILNEFLSVAIESDETFKRMKAITHGKTERSWYIWNGCYWEHREKADECETLFWKTSLKLLGDAVNFLNRMKSVIESNPLAKLPDDPRLLIIQQYLGDLIKKFADVCAVMSKDYNKNNTALRCVSGTSMFVSKTETYPYLMATNTGVVVLMEDLTDEETGEYYPLFSLLPEHVARERFIIQRANVDYNPADYDRFDELYERSLFKRFIEEVQPDESQRAFLQEYLGMSLLGAGKDRYLLFNIGRGANGKTTFFQAVKHTLGSYAKLLKQDTLASNLQSREAERAFAGLDGVRFGYIEEFDDKIDSSKVKRALSDGQILGRLLYREPQEIRMESTFVLSTNEYPEFNKDVDAALERRLRFIEWGTVIPEERRIKDMQSRLERERHIIFMWMLKGLERYIERGCRLDDTVDKKTKDFILAKTGGITRLVEECLEPLPPGAPKTEYALLSDLAYVISELHERVEMFKLKELINGSYRLQSLGITVRRVHVARKEHRYLIIGYALKPEYVVKAYEVNERLPRNDETSKIPEILERAGIMIDTTDNAIVSGPVHKTSSGTEGVLPIGSHRDKSMTGTITSTVFRDVDINAFESVAVKIPKFCLVMDGFYKLYENVHNEKMCYYINDLKKRVLTIVIRDGKFPAVKLPRSGLTVHFEPDLLEKYGRDYTDEEWLEIYETLVRTYYS